MRATRLVVLPSGVLLCRSHQYPCSFGRNGITLNKMEGDGCTPAGLFPIMQILYRADKIAGIRSGLPTYEIQKETVWCENPAHECYNHLVPKGNNHPNQEGLWREGDDLFDIVAPVEYNVFPTVPGAGSGIFLHVGRPNLAPTDGCIHLFKEDMLRVLEQCGEETWIDIRP